MSTPRWFTDIGPDADEPAPEVWDGAVEVELTLAKLLCNATEASTTTPRATAITVPTRMERGVRGVGRQGVAP
ncbi:MAG: hypothetical protein ABR540_23340 [Acidimicrobiales bacterium]